MELKKIRPFNKDAFRQSRYGADYKYRSPIKEPVYRSQVQYIAKLLGQTNLSLTEIKATLKNADTSDLLAHRLIQRLGLESHDSKNSRLSLQVDSAILDTFIVGYAFEVKSDKEECPLVCLSYCNEYEPEFEVNGSLVDLEESEWPILMYGLVGLVEDIQALSENTG
ncbi:hypothetical protein ACFLZ1_01370 [Patescibacteria group bacterium]